MRRFQAKRAATTHPHVVVLSGANGAGKSTTAPALLRGRLRVTEFVNADTIARGLSAFAPEQVAIDAGRLMLARLEQLARQRTNFAFETTPASRTFAPRLHRWIATGYALHLVYLWLPSADLAIARVQARVRAGGHDIPEDVIRRRYQRGVANFFQLYRELATLWRVYDNSGVAPRLIASGRGSGRLRISDRIGWKQFEDQGYGKKNA